MSTTTLEGHVDKGGAKDTKLSSGLLAKIFPDLNFTKYDSFKSAAEGKYLGLITDYMVALLHHQDDIKAVAGSIESALTEDPTTLHERQFLMEPEKIILRYATEDGHEYISSFVTGSPTNGIAPNACHMQSSVAFGEYVYDIYVALVEYKHRVTQSDCVVGAIIKQGSATVFDNFGHHIANRLEYPNLVEYVTKEIVRGLSEEGVLRIARFYLSNILKENR